MADIRFYQTTEERKCSLHAQIIANGRQIVTPKSLELSSKGVLSNLSCGPTTTGDLLKVLNYVWQLEEQHATSMSLVSSLRVELDEAQSQLQELLLNKKNSCEEVESISTRLAEERASWQEQQEQYITVAIHSVMQDLEFERESKRKLEVLYKTVNKEFRVARKSLFRAFEELQRERKARQLMEEVCDELAIEIGQDKARVEDLKRESAKVREEVEEERKMLQMAEIWREERVQMKLMEAKLELEEKNTALSKLRSQLKAFLKSKRAGHSAKDVTNHTKLESDGHPFDICVGNNLVDSFLSRGTSSGRYSVESGCDQAKQNAWPSYLDGDEDDDLHSIELNHEPLVGTASSKLRPQSYQHCKNEIVKIGLFDDSISTSDNCDLLVRKFRGVDTPNKDQQKNLSGNKEGGAVRNTEETVSQNRRWIELRIEKGEIREWGEADSQRQSKESAEWSSGVGDLQSLASESPRITMHSEGVFKTTKSSHRGYGNSQQQPGLPNNSSSPTRNWIHYFDLRSKVTTETGGDHE